AAAKKWTERTNRKNALTGLLTINLVKVVNPQPPFRFVLTFPLISSNSKRMRAHKVDSSSSLTYIKT
ncbi:MAG: hypothetical protein LBV23_06855, partial [Deltaproteobacteria bacterium]|nr:hypothetical protein [Deltaproteobacteria bacterium]